MTVESKKRVPQTPIQVEISALTHEGRGIARVDDKAIFVDGALTGESVMMQYTRRRSRYDEARVSEVLSASTDRVIPQCLHFGMCGGCSLQHLNTTAQLRHKQGVLLEQLQHFGGVTPLVVLPPLASASYGYRHKARFSVKYVDKKEKLLLGFRERQGRYVADLSVCEVLHPIVGHKLELFRTYLSRMKAYRQIPQIEIAIGDDEVALIFRNLVPLDDADQHILCELAEAASDLTYRFQIYLQPEGPDSIHLLSPAGGEPRLHYRLPDYDLDMRFHPADFTQINLAMNRQLVSLALNLLQLKPTDRALDLFCGLGNFTLPMARSCAEVVGVEASQTMVERGFENAGHNGVDGVSFIAADLYDPDQAQAWAQRTFDKVLLDPPRSGAAEVIAHLDTLQAQRIVYVSCNPATLARDAGLLVRAGYQLQQCGVIDMFPHTRHVESIALFVKT